MGPMLLAICTVFLVLAVIAIRIGVAIGSRKKRSSEPTQTETMRTAPSPQNGPRAVVSPRPAAPTTAFAKSQQTTVRGIGISLSFGHEERAVPQPHRGAVKLIWYAPGESLIHAGLVIDAGMLYLSACSLTWPGEPSAIITSLSVAATAAHPLQDFGYYPAYERVTPEQRRSYLEWLAAGRQDSDPSQRSLGHVFMFFYGLERRILLEHDRDPRLLEEVIRLLQHYGAAHKSRSLRTYFFQLLHFAGWQLGADAYRELWPRLLELDDDRPDEDGLRFVLANLHQRGESLDWTVAYRLALSSHESRRSTVVARAQEKFFALFQKRFQEQFADALIPEAAKQQTLVQYRPASSALAQMRYEARNGEALELRLPNVTGLHRQFKALPAIWNSCVDDLSGYSRALFSNKQGYAAALARWQSLPAELKRIDEHPLKAGLDELVANSPREGDYIFVPAAGLAALAEVPERAKLTIAHSRQLSEMVNGLGWQLAPSPDVTGVPLAWNQELALYRVASGEEAPQNLAGVTRLLYLAVTLAAADGAIEPEELDSFYQLVRGQIAREEDWIPLRATEASLRRDSNVALRSLPQMAKLIPMESRDFVVRTMAHIAAADGEVSLDEFKILRRMARAFGLDANAVEKLLREDEAFREITISGPERSGGRGEAIPDRPSSKAAAFTLDEARIKALTHETQEVISLLSVVMADPEEAPCPPPTAPKPMLADAAPATWLSGLDVRYHAAVVALVRLDEITTNDFDCLASDNHLMPADLFNAVNTWSDETLGDFLLARGENIRIFRSLLPDLAALPIAA